MKYYSYNKHLQITKNIGMVLGGFTNNHIIFYRRPGLVYLRFLQIAIGVYH